MPEGNNATRLVNAARDIATTTTPARSLFSHSHAQVVDADLCVYDATL
jgi:hypothetical protein